MKRAQAHIIMAKPVVDDDGRCLSCSTENTCHCPLTYYIVDSGEAHIGDLVYSVDSDSIFLWDHAESTWERKSQGELVYRVLCEAVDATYPDRRMVHDDMVEIFRKGGEVYYMYKDEFTNPEEYVNVAWGEGVRQPVYVDGKLLLSR